MRKLVLTLFIAVFVTTAYSQTVIDEKDGINITYNLSKVKEDEKNVYYSVTVKALNSNDYDLFYQGTANRVNPFALTVKESTSGTDYYLTGTLSRLQIGNIPLYYIKAKGSITTNKEFKIKKGSNPVFKLDYSSDFSKISDLK